MLNKILDASLMWNFGDLPVNLLDKIEMEKGKVIFAVFNINI